MDLTRLTTAQKTALAPFLAALAANREAVKGSIDNVRVNGTIDLDKADDNGE